MIHHFLFADVVRVTIIGLSFLIEGAVGAIIQQAQKLRAILPPWGVRLLLGGFVLFLPPLQYSLWLRLGIDEPMQLWLVTPFIAGLLSCLVGLVLIFADARHGTIDEVIHDDHGG